MVVELGASDVDVEVEVEVEVETAVDPVTDSLVVVGALVVVVGAVEVGADVVVTVEEARDRRPTVAGEEATGPARRA